MTAVSHSQDERGMGIPPEVILVADDDDDARDFIELVLRQAGYEVVTVPDGDEVFPALRQQRPSLILLDCQMPGLGGFEVCRQLKRSAQFADCPVIFLTGLTDTESLSRGFAAGGTDYITKPIQGEEMIARVRNHLDLYHARERLEARVRERTAELEQTNAELRESQARMAEALERERNTSMELEAAMDQLAAATEEAKAATLAKSQFLANMSHEIRTPMTGILGYANILKEESPACRLSGAPDRCGYGERQQEAIDAIQRNGEYLLKLINDILDLSRIEAGRLDIEQIACSPFDLMADIQGLVRARGMGEGVAFEIACDGPIPETIRTDPTRLRQILVNLVANAVKFTHEGEARLVARLRDPHARRPMIEFDVVDTGIGMGPDTVARLFQPFVQSDSSMTRKYGGSGLGLTISHRLAQMLGGSIKVESELGRGSRFRVIVPTGSLKGVRMLTEKPIDPPVAVPAANPQAQSLPPCRVLLVEDGPDNQRLISFMLRKAGAEVVVADNGQVGLDVVSQATAEGNTFDLILMDMQMPVLDGYAATRMLRERSYAGPIVALTAHAMAYDRQKCLDVGCDDYATKPIQKPQLIDLVARHLSSRDVATA